MPSPILVIDSDEDFATHLKDQKFAEFAAPMIAKSKEQAIEILKNKEQLLSGIFVNTAITSPFSIPLVRSSLIQRKVVPIFYLFDEANPPALNFLDIQGMGVRQILKKPCAYAQMTGLISPTFLGGMEFQSTLEKKVAEGTGPTQKDEFVSVHFANFLPGLPSLFDIYVQPAEGKFLKILKEGDSFGADRLKSFAAKGLNYFYIPKKSLKAYVSFCDQVADRTGADDVRTISSGESGLAARGRECTNFLKNHGVKDSTIQMAANVVQDVEKSVKSLNLNENRIMKKFLANLSGVEHGVATSMLGTALLQQTDFADSLPANQIGMAAFLHDAALFEMPQILWEEDESKMSEVQKKLYRQHPKKSASMLKPFLGNMPEVLEAVKRHHERVGELGFPKREGTTKVHRIGEIVGICDEFARLITMAEKKMDFNPFEVIVKDVFPGFSRPIVDAFRRAFMFNL